MPALWLVFDGSLRILAAGPGADGSDGLCFQYLVLANDGLFCCNGGQSPAPYMEFRGGGTVLHFFPTIPLARLALCADLVVAVDPVGGRGFPCDQPVGCSDRAAGGGFLSDSLAGL